MYKANPVKKPETSAFVSGLLKSSNKAPDLCIIQSLEITG